MTGGVSAATDEWRHNWPVVLAGTVGATVPSLYLYSTGVMMAPLANEFGWSRAAISSGGMIVAATGIFLAPIMGIAIDRFGPRRIALIGVSLFLAAFACFSTASPSIWSWWLLWTLFAIPASTAHPTVWAAAVSSLFSSSRGLALAVTLCGTGLGGILVPSTTNFLLEHYGWRAAYVTLAGLWAVVVLPLIWLNFYGASDKIRSGRTIGSAPTLAAAWSIPPRHAFRSATFVKLAVASSAIIFVMSGLMTNLVPILTFERISAATAAHIASVSGLGAIIGRLTGGYLLDRIDGKMVAGAIVLVPIVSSLILIAYPGSVEAAAIAVLIAGLAMGVEVDAIAYLGSRHFGIGSFGTVYGVIMGLQVLMAGLAPMIVNHAYDVTGSYLPALWVFIPGCLLSSSMFLLLGPYPVAPAPSAE